MNSDFNKPGNQQQQFKRKKKRSFMQQVKKRFKNSASFSKGVRFPQIEHEYFMRVFELERIFDGTPEEKIVFANNALAQTENREVECSNNQLISRVVEKLLPLASTEVLEKYFEAFCANMRPICVHDFASHVLQALMIQASKHSLDEYSDVQPKHRDYCKVWLLKVSRFLLNNVEEFMWDRCANPVLRTAILCLAGMPQLDKHNAQDKNPTNLTALETQKPTYILNEEFVNLLEEYCTRILAWPQFTDFANHALLSGFLQCLLRALKSTKVKKYNSLRKKIITMCFPSSTDNNTYTVFTPSSLPLLEVMLEQSNEKTRKEIYDHVIAGRVVDMAIAKVGNMTLQKFINNCKDPKMVAELMTTLAPEFHKILEVKNEGVIVSLCQACERSKTAQSEFLKALMGALKCDGEQLASAVLPLRPLPHESAPPHSRNGSLLLQSLLNFQKPIKLINSLLSYEPEQLAELFSTPYGCYVSGAFCKSTSIGEKSKLRLINRLMGYYPALAQSKFGSRSFDDLWDVADIKSRAQLVKDLASGFSEVMASQYGKFVAAKVRLEVFRSQGADKWSQRILAGQNKQKLFAHIIEENK